MQQVIEKQDMANQMVTIFNYPFSKEVSIIKMWGLWIDKPNKPCKQFSIILNLIRNASYLKVK